VGVGGRVSGGGWLGMCVGVGVWVCACDCGWDSRHRQAPKPAVLTSVKLKLVGS
jgi:hypothetical protein